jgi:hypothetical protein
MSYIDSYKHEVVGLLAGVPVYHPLENIPGSTFAGFEEDFACSTKQLVVGGGSGEHPGVVLCNPEAAVAAFLLCHRDIWNSERRERYLRDKRDDTPRFVYAGWRSQDHDAFQKRCREHAWPNPFRADQGQDFETWLHLGFGEFIFYAMPQLANSLIETVAPLDRKPRTANFFHIMLFPPGIPPLGRGEMMQPKI